MKFLEAQKQSGKEQKKSIRDDGLGGENKMQPGNREGQRRGNNLDRNNPQSLISGTHQQTGENAAGGTSNEKGAVAALARELGVDLGKVRGTGPRGTITEKDVRDADPNKDK